MGRPRFENAISKPAVSKIAVSKTDVSKLVRFVVEFVRPLVLCPRACIISVAKITAYILPLSVCPSMSSVDDRPLYNNGLFIKREALIDDGLRRQCCFILYVILLVHL